MYRSGSRRVISLPVSSNVWSSSEYNTQFARNLYFSNGYVYYGNNKFGSYVVRPVAAFEWSAEAD